LVHNAGNFIFHFSCDNYCIHNNYILFTMHQFILKMIIFLITWSHPSLIWKIVFFLWN
jgi:hypothetical protein